MADISLSVFLPKNLLTIELRSTLITLRIAKLFYEFEKFQNTDRDSIKVYRRVPNCLDLDPAIRYRYAGNLSLTLVYSKVPVAL